MRTMPYGFSLLLGIALASINIAAPSSAIAGTETLTNHVAGLLAAFCQIARLDVTIIPEQINVSTNSTNTVATFQIADKRSATWTIDPARDEVEAFSSIKSLPQKHYSNGSKVSDAELAVRGTAMLAKLGINTNSVEDSTPTRAALSGKRGPEMVRLFWRRQTQGFRFKDDFVSLMFDGQDGELMSYKKSWGPPPPSLKVTISLTAAKEIASKYLAPTGSNEVVKFKTAETWVVSPNTLLNAPPTDPSTGSRRLAWVLEVPKQPGTGKHVEIWVDAESGAVLGGEMLL